LDRNKALILSVVIFSASMTPAHAYLDPGTGSIILQGLIGGAVVAGSFISIYWSKFKALFKRNDAPPSEEPKGPDAP
jgi:hypothetical protein